MIQLKVGAGKLIVSDKQIKFAPFIFDQWKTEKSVRKKTNTLCLFCCCLEEIRFSKIIRIKGDWWVPPYAYLFDKYEN